MATAKIFIFGLDRAGKTVVTNFLTKGTVEENTRPSLAFTQQQLILPTLKCALWDTPGQKKFRNLWPKSGADADILVYMLDTSDSQRFPEAKEEMTGFIRSLTNMTAPMIFLYHKMDKPEAQTNLAKAKEFMDVEHIYIKDVHPLETSVKDVASLNKLKEKIQELLVKRTIVEAGKRSEEDKRAQEIKEKEKEAKKKK